MKKIIIAIDGLSSTGKSTFAKAIAAALGYKYLDSGACYRAVTLYALQNGLIDSNSDIDCPALKAALPLLQIDFRVNPHTLRNEAFLNGRNVEQLIRTLNVSNNVSAVSSLDFVRAWVDRLLHRWGEGKGIVMDGRDIGTAVFPQAELKIFMTAPAAIRAQRRFKEMTTNGEKTTFEEVLSNVESRDYQDSHRKTHPLVQAPDAIVLDNGQMSVEQQMDWFMKLFEEKWGTASQ